MALPFIHPPLLREDFLRLSYGGGKICVSCKIQLNIKIMKYQKSSQKILNVSLAHSGNFHTQGTFFRLLCSLGLRTRTGLVPLSPAGYRSTILKCGLFSRATPWRKISPVITNVGCFIISVIIPVFTFYCFGCGISKGR